MRLLAATILSLCATPLAAQTAGGMGFPINCAIRPLRVVEVAAPAGGVIREVHVRPGLQISVGDPIASFDADIAHAGYEAAMARAGMTASRDAALRRRDALTKRVERLQRGVEQRVVSAADLEIANLELATVEGQIERENELIRMASIEAEQARIALEKTEILSPASGQVGEELIDAGESPGAKPVAVIYVNQPLRVEAFVPTATLADFIARDRFEIVVNGNREKPVPVNLDYVSQVADLSSNTQSVYFTLDAPDILPGYQCLFLPQMG